MQSFTNKLAVITGGGSGIGAELCRRLAQEGCSIAMCDLSDADMASSRKAAESTAATGVQISTFRADVAQESQLEAFAKHVAEFHQTDHIELLFNNAGIGGAGSFLKTSRANWERVFNVCWNGVYFGTRTFMPMLLRSQSGHIVNISSMNGLWASLGFLQPQSAYATAKFAVRGFTEALVTDFRVNAPHLKASVVFPGTVGTRIAANTLREFGADKGISEAEMQERQERFMQTAVTSVEEAAEIILRGVREKRWRIVLGKDAEGFDQLLRESPETAYDEDFLQRLAALLQVEPKERI